MIKYFCDKCGKEIESGNLCSSCQEEELTCGFKVGDVVITDDGKTGVIKSLCTCERCKQRGFYEPKVAVDNDAPFYISHVDRDEGFANFYRIGNRVFGNIDRSAPSGIEEFISISKKKKKRLKADIRRYKKQLKTIKTLEAEQRKGETNEREI